MSQNTNFSSHQTDIPLSKATLKKIKDFSSDTNARLITVAAWVALISRYSGQEELDWLEYNTTLNLSGRRSISISQENGFQDLLNILSETPGSCDSDTEVGTVPINGKSLRIAVADSVDIFSDDEVLLFIQKPESHEPPFIAANTNLLSLEFLEQMAAHLSMLLEHCLENPKHSLFEFPLLTEEERRDALINWNVVEQFDCTGRTLHGLFAEQAAAFPERIAISCQGRELTYQELDERSNRIAHAIRALYELTTGEKMRPDELIGLSTDRSPDMIIGILAVLKAGGAYVPLDPRYPEDRLKFMAEDARCRIILTQQHHLENLLYMVDGDYGIISLDTGWEHLSSYPATQPDPISTDTNLAYVIYTSGSTGKPKGVMLEHGCAVRLFYTTEALFNFNEEDVWTCFHSYAFDFSVWEIWGALLHGARLVLVPYNTSREPDRFHELVRRERVTIMSQTPSSFYQFSEADKNAEHSCTTLRYVIFGGEALNIARLESWWLRHPWDAPRLINMYGITETTVHATFHEVAPDDLKRKSALSPIGEKLSDLSFYVLDSRLQPMPPGIPGELYIGGAGVARGYFRRDDLNRERFIDSPFAKEIGPGAHSRLYKSGDLVVRRQDGTLDYLGRADFQVKIRGFRIETGEIETILEKHADIRESVVLAYGEGEEKKLAAYYITNDGNPIATRVLWEHLACTLPVYMIPSRFIHMHNFKLSPTGKTDRKALPAPDIVPDQQDRDDMVVPKTGTERRLARIWSDLLNYTSVGARDNFFMLGGDSLLGARMVMLCRQAFSRNLSIKDVFEHPVLEELARCIEASDAVQYEEFQQDPLPDACPKNQVTTIPASPAQRSMYYTYHAEPPETYNVPFLARFDGPLNHTFLEEALNRLLERHESLRTTFLFEHGELFQRINAHQPYTLPLEKVAENDISVTCSRWAKQVFDLERYPLFDIRLIESVNGKSAVYFNIHHIVFDGNSYDVLLKDLGRSYAAVSTGRPPLPVPHMQYRHYAHAMRESIQSQHSQKNLRKLAEHFKGMNSEIHWPHSVLMKNSSGENLVRRHLDHDTTRKLSSLARERKATLFALLLALYQSSIFALSGQDDLTVGVPVSSRTLFPHADDLIGFLVVTAPFRTRFTDTTTLNSLIDNNQRDSLAMLDRQEVPLDALAEMLDKRNRQGGNPMFRALFAMENSMSMNGSWQGQNYELEQLFNGSAKFDTLLFCFNRQEQGLEVILEYNPEKPGRHTAEILIDIFVHGAQKLAEQAGTDASIKLRSLLSGLLPTDRAEITANRSEAEYPAVSLGRLFKDCAKKYHDRPALVYDGRTLNYWQLDALSDQTAYDLLSKVGPPQEAGDCIGIHLRRGPEMVPAMLGILKAGYAYLPLDPDMPAERLSRIYSHARPSLVICKDENSIQGIPDRVLTRFDSLTNSSSVNLKEISPDAPAYILYTSGTTGMPKGVMVGHRSAVNRVCWMQREYGLTTGEKYLFKTPCHFDVSVGEIFWPLTCGATLIVSGPDCHRDPACILGLLESERINNVHFVPAMLSIFLDYLDSGEEIELAHLKRIFCSGEGLPQTLVNRCKRKLNVEIHNLYGPTETGESSAQPCPEKAPGQGPDIVPIGFPISNTRYYLLNPAGIPVPNGLCGELHIAGDCLAEGYLREPKRTDERFISSELIPEKRLYRTGDIVAWGQENLLEYHGRTDHQIKIRGFRVELGEIESAIMRLEGVRFAAARYFQQSPQGPCIIADYAGDDSSPDPEEIQTALKKVLPSYMVPAKIFKRDQLPVTPSGKVDRKSLPEPEFSMLGGISSPGSRTQIKLDRTEQELAELWARLLGQEPDQFNPDSDFFQYGGHSLLLMQMIVELRKEKGHEIKLPVFLQKPTLGYLAELCKDDEHGAQKDTSIDQAYKDSRLLIDWESGPSLRVNADKKTVLLTGAGGFVGTHILKKLLCSKKQPVIALVRPKDGLDPAQTLDRALNTRNISLEPEARKLLRVCKMDLAAPGLALEELDLDVITNTVGHILHCGAMVNHLYGYAQHRQANVLGTLELIRLAVKTGIRRFDFISTTGAVAAEDQPDPNWSGYLLSKWTGERFTERMRRHDFDARILRVGYVTGHSRSGLVDHSRNHLSLLIRACAETGVAPDWDRKLEITPVDFLASEIIRLINMPQAAHGSWNLSGVLRLTWTELIIHIENNGYPVKITSHQEWYAEYLEKAPEGSALHMLKGLYTEETPCFPDPLENNFLELHPTTHTQKDMDLAQLFRRYMNYYLDSGFIEKNE
ncbi:non-ribosomal peptide synthetase [Maridesulfovibrio sp.]|uniref:non-ribosomal peptide synthetase n=1 Tax=Maridesulfovibrio sp. TaxID=2795000 RepID=UPI0029CAA860|nr:non-ribosomal peptide synthetase [Maridesulfovibrio sp.]